MANANKALRALIRKQSAEWLDQQPAKLGDGTGSDGGIVLTDTAGIYNARLINGKVVQVYNQARIAPIPDLQISIGRRRSMPTIWQIVAVDEVYDVPAAQGQIEYHHEQHEEGGGDQLFLDRKQIMQLSVRVFDAAGFVVIVYGGLAGNIKVDTQPVDLSSYVITSGAKYVAIEENNSGVLSINAGTVFGSPAIATASDLPVPASGKYTVAWVLFYEGQTELSDDDIVVPMPPLFNPLAYSSSAHDHDTRYPRKYTGKTTAPTINDDSGDGYAVDDIWIDETNDKAYIALDVTVGAAVWQEVGAGGDVGAAIHAADASALSDEDEFGFWENVADALKKITWANIKATLKTYFDTLYAAISHSHTGLVTNGDSHDHSGGDGAAITEAAITLADNTTNDVSTTKHGFVPKAPNDATKFLRGDGLWAVPEGWDVIEDSGDIGSSQPSFDFQTIPTSGYVDLEWRYSLRSDRADVGDGVKGRCNNDTTGNNHDYFIWYDGPAVGASESAQVNQTSGQITTVAAANTPANGFDTGIIWMNNYRSNKHKELHCRGINFQTALTTGMYIMDGAVKYRATDPITRVTFFPSGGSNWVAGSRMVLLGRKA